MTEIHLIEKVFRDNERKKLLEDSKPLLLSLKNSGGATYPGKQTLPNLQMNPKFEFPLNHLMEVINKKTRLNLALDRAWVNWTNGRKKDLMWHNHPSDYSAVYYMKTPLPWFSNGTLFRTGLIKTPENSVLIFPSHLEHTAPTSPFRFGRYTLALDLNIKNKIRIFEQDYS